MTANNPLDHSLRLQALTREYARFSRSAGGLSAIAGGAFCLMSWLAGGLLPTTPALRGVLIALPLLWLIGKHWMARRYYQRFGHAAEQSTPVERGFQRFFVAFTALVSVVILVALLSLLQPFGDRVWEARWAGYLGVVAALPFVVWAWLRTPLEFIVGVFLLCQAALAFAGRPYHFESYTFVFPIASLALIAAGIRDHRSFQRIEKEIRLLISTPMQQP